MKQTQEMIIHIAGNKPNLIEKLTMKVPEGTTHINFINMLSQCGFKCAGAVLVIANAKELPESSTDPLKADELLENEDCFYLPEHTVPPQNRMSGFASEMFI